MSLSNLSVKARYNANGSNTTFAIPGAIMVDDDSEVIVYTRDESTTPATEVLQVEGSDYNLSGATPPGFNTNVVFTAAPTSGLKVVVYHLMPLTQTLDVNDNTNQNLSSWELAIDRVVKMIQQVSEAADRALKFQLTSGTSGISVDEPVDGYILQYDAASETFLLVDPTSFAADTTSLTAHIAATVFGTETQVSLTNNQASPVAISGLAFSESTYRAVEVKYTIERRTDTQSYRQFGRLICLYDERTASWSLSDIIDAGASGETSGVQFSIDNTGQVYYSSDDTTGASHVGNLRYIEIYKFLKET